MKIILIPMLLMSGLLSHAMDNDLAQLSDKQAQEKPSATSIPDLAKLFGISLNDVERKLNIGNIDLNNIKLDLEFYRACDSQAD